MCGNNGPSECEVTGALTPAKSCTCPEIPGLIGTLSFKGDTGNVTSVIGYIFVQCPALTSAPRPPPSPPCLNDKTFLSDTLVEGGAGGGGAVGFQWMQGEKKEGKRR